MDNTVLAGEIAKFVNGFGLHPYFGFMHKTHNSFQALVYDLIEPFRWLVEDAVYKLAVEEPMHGRMIKKDEYAWTREGKIILDSGIQGLFAGFLSYLRGLSKLNDFTNSNMASNEGTECLCVRKLPLQRFMCKN